MTTRYELVDKFKIIDAFEPSKVLAVVLDKDFAKQLVDVLNTEHESSKKISELRNEVRGLKIANTKLTSKLDKFREILTSNPEAAADVDIKTTSDGDIKLPRKKSEFKPRQCPGFGSSHPPHEFMPTAGNQKMCPECKAAMLAASKAEKKKVKESKGLVTEVRGTSFYAGPNAVRQPTVEEVVNMLPGPEKEKWQSKWSEAERKEAQIIKNRQLMEKMKKMKHKGFSPDDPIMGVNAPIPK